MRVRCWWWRITRWVRARRGQGQGAVVVIAGGGLRFGWGRDEGEAASSLSLHVVGQVEGKLRAPGPGAVVVLCGGTRWLRTTRASVNGQVDRVKSATLACKCERERTARSRSCLHTSVRQGEARVMARWDWRGGVDRLGAGTSFVTGHKIVTCTHAIP